MITPYELATRVNLGADRDHKLSITQADWLLSRMESDQQLFIDFVEHIWPAPPVPNVQPEIALREEDRQHA